MYTGHRLIYVFGVGIVSHDAAYCTSSGMLFMNEGLGILQNVNALLF